MDRKIIRTVSQVKMDDEDHLDVLFWKSKSAWERLEQVVRLRKNYYTSSNGSFPEKIEKVVNWRKLNPDK